MSYSTVNYMPQQDLGIYRHYLTESYIEAVTKDCLISYTYVVIRNVKFIVRVAQIRTHFIEHVTDACKDDEFTLTFLYFNVILFYVSILFYIIVFYLTVLSFLFVTSLYFTFLITVYLTLFHFISFYCIILFHCIV